jgi:predicted Zn-dependent protease
MLSEAEIRAITERVLAQSPADQTEVVVLANDEQLTRFANNEIHQNVAETNAEIRIRAVFGQQVGVAVTNNVSDQGLRRTLDSAVEIARRQAPNPDFHSLPSPQPLTPIDAYVQATGTCLPNRRAAAAGTICRLAAEAGLVGAGAFSTAASGVAVANSLGVWTYEMRSNCQLSTVVMGEDSSGWAARASMDIDDIDAESAGREAVETAVRGRAPEPLDPGVYPVVLNTYAVAEMLSYLNYIGFGALALQEGRSPLEIGADQAAPSITVVDDGGDRSGLPMSFDFEGVPKQRVEIITAGVTRGVVYDEQTAAKEGKQSTGHALTAPNVYGPLALNLFMAAGTTPTVDLARGIERGIFVNRFWYVNVVHPKKAILTGMTRDGAFLIENGEITRPIRNLRFTESVLHVLRNVEDVGKETTLDRDYLGVVRAPALRVGAFTFSSTTA